MFLSSHLDGIFTYMLSNPPYSLTGTQSTFAAPLFRNAFMSHYAGDEKISPEEQTKVDVLGGISPQLGGVLRSIRTDLPPADNKVHIDLK